MLSRVVFVLALFGAALTVTAPVHAQVKGAPRLEFSGAPGCSDEASFRDVVAIFFGSVDPFNAEAPDVVRVTFTKIPGGYRGSVQYTPPEGDPWPTEEKSGPLCSVIFRAVARVASMRVPDPAPKDAPAPAEPESADPEPAPPLPPAPISKPAEPSPPKGPAPWAPPPIPGFSRVEPLRPADDMPYTISLSGFVLMTAGYTDNVAPGFQLAVEMRSNTEESYGLRVGLELRYLLPDRVTAREPTDPTKGTSPEVMDISQVSALLVPCFRWRYFLGCGVADGGAVIAQTSAGGDSNPTLRLGPRLGLEVPFAERFAVRAFGEALFAVVTSGFAVTPNGDYVPNVTWNYPLVAGFFGVGLSVRFD